MDYIFAPWRIEYIQSEKPNGCIFCTKPGQTCDEENYILYRGEYNFIIMNSYPYNPGHLMVVPYRHTSKLEEFEEEERNEHFALVTRVVTVLKKVFKPDGFNIGINIGRIAGAGIDDHVHTHIVPRWNGDTNFMPVFADVRVVPQALEETYQIIREAL